MRKNQMFQDISYIVLFALLIGYMLMSSQVSAQPKYEHLIEVEVHIGDTLWSIASEYTEGMAIPAYISLLKIENNLKGDRIYPGQILLVPRHNIEEVVTVNEGDYILSCKY
jgi:hypothetical protein